MGVYRICEEHGRQCAHTLRPAPALSVYLITSACPAPTSLPAGLNCGRWDYIFSFIKKLRNHPQYVLPDRSAVNMTSPFMDAYVRLLIKTCHKR